MTENNEFDDELNDLWFSNENHSDTPRYKRYILGEELKTTLNTLSKTHMDSIVKAEKLDGEPMYLTTAFMSVIDTDLSDQVEPDIGIRAHKHPDNTETDCVLCPTRTVTVKDLIESAAAVERLEGTDNFNQMDVIILLHDIADDGYDEDYPDLLPVEKIEITDDNTITLKCNKY